ncbi:OB-fold nucleic acid binding domain-containing protein [Pseudarthrobacter sp. NPDC058362]|uniref:OB-fold nucleic acid binding domain-containing protein n=1 Tax=unclassified Pseudarthrobacter TaxID=2647000 RepID=UPI003646EC43
MADPMATGPGSAQPDGDVGCLSLDRLPAKGRVLCCGRIESVTYVPPGETPAFTAIVSDSAKGRKGRAARPGGEHGRLRVVWLGRRRVPGIEPGTELRLEGMLSHSRGLPTIYNPRYEILSRQENE